MGLANQRGVLFKLWENLKYSCLCDQHFEDKCFVISPRLAESTGFKTGHLQLKSDGIPSLFQMSCENVLLYTATNVAGISFAWPSSLEPQHFSFMFSVVLSNNLIYDLSL